MSVDRFMYLMTEKEFDKCNSSFAWGESWYHNVPPKVLCFDFGDARDTLEDGTRLSDRCDEIDGLNAQENKERLRFLWQKCSTMDSNSWQNIEDAIDRDSQLNIYFFSI